MGRLIIASNRLHVSVQKIKGEIKLQSSVGGLASGLGSYHTKERTIWVGWPGIAEERLSKEEKEEVQRRLEAERCRGVFLSHKEIENYYYGFCNKIIWPLFHYLPQYTVYEPSYWRAYIQANLKFAEVIGNIIKENDILWIHDYHLFLLPRILRDRFPDTHIGFFLHIPFPSFEIFRLIPWRREIIDGLLGADLIGFHTYDYVSHFLKSASILAGYDHQMGTFLLEDRIVKVDSFPIGIEFNKWYHAKEDPIVKREITRIKNKVGNRKIILSIDRLDYTKGIPLRLEAFEAFLSSYPEYREKVSIIMIVVPSRTGSEHYIMLKREIDELIGRINGRFGTIGWNPIWYIYRSLPFHTLAALYSLSHIALITPLRDGMNLIAKEYVATKNDEPGVLILSEFAGASRELRDGIIINPNDREMLVRAIKEAMDMNTHEQRRRIEIMQKRLKRYTIKHWANEFIESLSKTKRSLEEKTTSFNIEHKSQMLVEYKRAKNRIFLLDYDGTLIPFSPTPDEAKPDLDLTDILKKLGGEEKCEVVILSGRKSEILEKWFGHLPLSLVAEHGAHLKEKDGGWHTLYTGDMEWKSKVRFLMELYVDRTPGAFIEDKGVSVAWHHRRTEGELGERRAKELREELTSLAEEYQLDIVEGNRVLEIRPKGVNKGGIVMKWLSTKKWGFIFSAGDDTTDEDMFSVLPPGAWSFKVGHKPSQARFRLKSYKELRKLLKELSE